MGTVLTILASSALLMGIVVIQSRTRVSLLEDNVKVYKEAYMDCKQENAEIREKAFEEAMVKFEDSLNNITVTCEKEK